MAPKLVKFETLPINQQPRKAATRPPLTEENAEYIITGAACLVERALQPTVGNPHALIALRVKNPEWRKEGDAPLMFVSWRTPATLDARNIGPGRILIGTLVVGEAYKAMNTDGTPKLHPTTGHEMWNRDGYFKELPVLVKADRKALVEVDTNAPAEATPAIPS